MKRILLIDDDPLFIECAAPEIAQQGYAVERLFDPRKAEEVIHRTRPAIVITDEMMPYILGHELVARIRRSAPEIPCILISGVVESIPVEEIQGVTVISKSPCSTFCERVLRPIRDAIGYAYEPTRRGHGLPRIAALSRRAITGIACFCGRP